MAWAFNYSTDGSTWTEIDNSSVSKVRHTSQRHRDLKPSTDTFDFQVRYPTTTLLNAILGSNAFEFKAELNGSAIFRGWISSEASGSIRRRVKQVPIKAYDESWLFDRKIGSTINWQNFYVAKAADTDHSIVHQLMLLYGLDISRIDPEDDLDQIDYFVAEDDETFQELLERLLLEYGWIFYLDAAGTMKTEALFPADDTTVATFADDNTANLTFEKKPIQKDGVQVTYWAHETIADAQVSSDTTNGDETLKCNVSLAADGYYPLGSDVNDVFTEFSAPQRDLICALSPAIDATYESGIVQSSPTYYPRKALVYFHNTAGSAKALTKFDIIADVVVKGDQGIVRVFNADELHSDLLEIEARFLTTFAQGSYLCSGVAQYYKYSSISYNFVSRTLEAVGAIVQLTTTAGGISQVCRIYARSTTWQNDGTPVYEYALEGVAEYALQTIDAEGSHPAPPSPLSPAQVNALEGAMTKVQYINGFEGDGGTLVPTVPTIAYAKGGGRNVAIAWDRQNNLTNFERYEIQVSEDDAAWYSLKFDGTDWKDTLDGVTVVYSEVAVHTLIPYLGDATTPLDHPLYYHVRRVTKAAVNSDWSSSVVGTASPVDSSDMVAGSVLAGKLATGVLDALIANISQYIQISSDGVLGQNFIGDPYDGAQRCRIYQSGLVVEEYDGAAWVTKVKVGGVENGSIFPWLQAAGLSAVGAADDLGDLGLGDAIPQGADAFEFEDSLTGINGTTPWTGSATEYTTTHKYGAKALRSTAGNVGTLTDADAQGMNMGRSFAIDSWLDITAFQDETVLKLESTGPQFAIPGNGSFTPSATAKFLHSNVDNANGIVPTENAVQLDATHSVVVWVKDNAEIHARCGLKNADASISWGADKTLVTETIVDYLSVCRISDTSFAVAYQAYPGDASAIYHKALKCTVTGTTVDSVVATLTNTESASFVLGSRLTHIDALDSSTLIWTYVMVGSGGANIGDLRVGIIDISTWAELDSDFVDTTGSTTNPCFALGIAGLSSTKAIVLYHYLTTGTAADVKVIGLDWSSPNLTFGSPVTVTSIADYRYLTSVIRRASATIGLLEYRGASDKVKLRTASISGTTVSLGTEYDTTETTVALVILGGISYSEAIDGTDYFQALWPIANGSNRDVRLLRFSLSGTSIVAWGSAETILSNFPSTDRYCLAASAIASITTFLTLSSGVITGYVLTTLYSRIRLACVSSGSVLKLLLDNFGATPESGSSVIATAGSGWYHISINYNYSTRQLSGTVNSAVFDALDLTGDQIATGAHSLIVYSNDQRQIWDDLMVLANGTITTAASAAHAVSGNPWSAVDWSPDTDVALFPRAGGDIVKFGGILRGPKGRSLSISADYSLQATDGYDVIRGTTGSSADITVTLPALSGSGKVYRFEKIDTGTKKFIVDGNGSEKIGVSATALTFELPFQGQWVELEDAGAYWEICDFGAPLPQSAAGVGEWKVIVSASGGGLSLPAGGTWAWFGWQYNAATGAMTGQANAAGVSAGGSAIVDAAAAGFIKQAVCWRIT